MGIQTGELGKGTWRMLNDWGKVALDLQVRKNGFVTGFTYGFVAGVKARFCSRDFKSSLSEYYILEERDVTNHQSWRLRLGGCEQGGQVNRVRNREGCFPETRSFSTSDNGSSGHQGNQECS